MKTIVNGNEVISFASMLLPEGQQGIVEFIHEGDVQRFSIEFKTDKSLIDDETNTRQLRFQGEENQLSIVFVNWDSPLGIANSEAIEVGVTDQGRPIFILAYASKAGSVYRVDLQTMVGEKHVAGE